MSNKAKDIIKDAPWLELTYRIIGLAMEVHNELGPGHREGVYHNAMVAKFRQAGINFEDDPLVPVTLDDGTVVGGNKPDLVVEQTVIVELKGRSHLMTKDDQAQVIGYFAGLPHCPIALYINFGRPRLEFHRLLPPKKVKAFQRAKWGKPLPYASATRGERSLPTELPPQTRDAVIGFTRDLVRIPSLFGHEKEMAEAVARRMRALGFDHVEIDAAGSAIGIIEGATAGPTLLLDAHIDTIDVHPRQAWSHDPFGGELTDDRIYGRGSSDMKGALAGMVYAAAGIDRKRIAGRVVVSASVAEEIIEGRALKEVMERYPPDFVVIGEASDLNLVRGGRGRAEFVLHTKGKPAHTSVPHQGVNAVHKMMRVVEAVEALPLPTDPVVGRGVMALAGIISDPYPPQSVVPSGCTATYERRLVPADTLDGLMTELRQACEEAGAPDTEIELAIADFTTYTGVRWRHPKWFPAWVIEEDHELVQKALRGLRRAGLDPQFAAYQFCTNAAYSAGEAGVPTIGFGPSPESMAHIVDEYLEVEQLLKAAQGYAAIIAALLEAG